MNKKCEMKIRKPKQECETLDRNVTYKTRM